MEQITRFKRKMVGAHGSELCDGHYLATQVFGEDATYSDSGLTAIAYLWRRFGPPWHGTDSHKRIISYDLTTDDPDVLLTIDVGCSGLAYSIGYMVTAKLYQQFQTMVFGKYWDWNKKLENHFWQLHKHMPHKTDSEVKKIQDLYLQWTDDKKNMKAVEKKIGKRPSIKRVGATHWQQGNTIQKRVNRAIIKALKELLVPVDVRDQQINIFGVYEGDTPSVPYSKYAGYGVPFKAMQELVKSK